MRQCSEVEVDDGREPTRKPSGNRHGGGRLVDSQCGHIHTGSTSSNSSSERQTSPQISHKSHIWSGGGIQDGIVASVAMQYHGPTDSGGEPDGNGKKDGISLHRVAPGL